MRKGPMGLLVFAILLTAGFAGLFVGSGGSLLQTAFEHDRILSLDTNGMNQTDPDMVIDGDMLFVVWSDDRNGTWDIVSRTSNDAGASWGPEVSVDDTLRNKVGYDDRSDQVQPRAAIDSDGTIHVVWMDDRDGRDLVYAGTSSDGGGNFSASHIVSDTSGGHQANPDIVGNGAEVYIVWEDTKGGKEGIYWTRTSDGVNFDSAVLVSDAPSSVKCIDPAIACTQSGIHVVWADDRTFDLDIYLSSSYDVGSTWSASALVSRDPSSSDQFEPEIAANATTLSCLFVDTRYSSADVFMAVSRDAGLTIEKEFLLNSENSKGAQTGIRADVNRQGNMTVVWTSSPGFYDSKADIQTIVVLPNGTLGAISTVNDPVVLVSQGEPACVISDSNIIHCAWADYRRPHSPGSTTTQKDVYYTHSTESGEEGKAPVIDSVKVSPEVGRAGDSFTFTARYSDVEGDAPEGGAPLLHLYFMSNSRLFYYPGAPYTMNKKLIPPQDQDYRNGEEYIITIMIEKGLDIFYQVGAKAVSGNQSEVRSPLLHLPMIDITAPTFTKLSPKDGTWSDSNIVELVVRITDLQSGVDPTQVGFRRYLPNQAGWEERWQSRGTYSSDGNGSIIFRGNMTFDDSDGNLVVFRAKDMAGNPYVGYPYARSPDYPIWVDTKGPVVTMESPRTGSIISSPMVDIESRVTDDGCGVDPDSVEVSYKLDGSSVYSMWANLSEFQDVEVLELKDGFYVSFDIPLAYGTFNFVRIRSKDVLGNQGSSGEVQLIIKKDTPVVVDRPPGPVTSIQPKVTGSMLPHITWAQSVDPEGDKVSYRFRILQVGMSEPFLDWMDLQSGTTYWDPPETMDFTAGAQYTIEIIPVANKLEGPLARSTMTISTDANSPPGKVKDMSPKATGESRPVLRWTPSFDPEGSHVYYFIRIWREATGAVLVPWTTVANGTAFRVPMELMMGVYTVNILCSDGTDFSPMSTFLLSLGVFSPKVDPERSLIVIYQDTSVSINVTVENEGYLFDTIGVVLTGQALEDQTLEIILSKGSVDLVAGGTVNVTLSISAAEFASVGFRSMNITVRSGDGVTTYSKPISIRVVDPDDPYGEEDEPQPLPETEDNSTTIVYILVIVLFLLIAAMVIAFIMVDRRQREERVEVVREQLPVKKRDNLKDEGSLRREKLRGRESKRRLPPKP